MKKKPLIYLILVLLTFLILTPPLTASDCYCCIPGCGPLQPWTWSVQVKGGGEPSHYTSRGPIWLTFPTDTPAVITVNNTPHFNRQFHTPWLGAAELAWNASPNVQFFVEGIYKNGSEKRNNFTAGAFVLSETYGDFKSTGAYLGARYYGGIICCRFAPFAGFKAGILYQCHNKVDITLFGEHLQKSIYFKSQWVPSVAAQVGVDFLINCHWSVVFTAEAMVTQGRKTNPNIVIENTTLALGLTNVNIGETGKIVSFPLTLGLKYTF